MKTPTPAYTHPTRRQRTALASQSIWTTAFMQQSTAHNGTRSRHAVQHAVLQPRSSQPTASNPPANKQHTLHSFASQPTSTMDPFNTTGPRHTLASIWQHAPVASKPSCPAPDCPARTQKASRAAVAAAVAVAAARRAANRSRFSRSRLPPRVARLGRAPPSPSPSPLSPSLTAPLSVTAWGPNPSPKSCPSCPSAEPPSAPAASPPLAAAAAARASLRSRFSLSRLPPRVRRGRSAALADPPPCPFPDTCCAPSASDPPVPALPLPAAWSNPEPASPPAPPSPPAASACLRAMRSRRSRSLLPPRGLLGLPAAAPPSPSGCWWAWLLLLLPAGGGGGGGGGAPPAAAARAAALSRFSRSLRPPRGRLGLLGAASSPPAAEPLAAEPPGDKRHRPEDQTVSSSTMIGSTSGSDGAAWTVGN